MAPDKKRGKAKATRLVSGIVGIVLVVFGARCFSDAVKTGVMAPAIWFILWGFAVSFGGAFAGREDRNRDKFYGIVAFLLATASVFSWSASTQVISVSLFVAEVLTVAVAWLDAFSRPETGILDTEQNKENRETALPTGNSFAEVKSAKRHLLARLHRKVSSSGFVSWVITSGIAIAGGAILTQIYFEGPWHWRLFYVVMIGMGIFLGLGIVVVVVLAAAVYFMEWWKELRLLWSTLSHLVTRLRKR